MTYMLAGFTFTFTQDANGLVTDITTPDIQIGPTLILQGYTLHLDPATTVDGAQLIVAGILGMLGIL